MIKDINSLLYGTQLASQNLVKDFQGGQLEPDHKGF